MMNRRQFLALLGGAFALPAIAVSPLPTDSLMMFWGRGWDFSITRDPQTFWWTFLAEFKPTGVKYGWKVAEQRLVDLGMTPEDLMRFSISRFNPYYAS